MVTAATRRDARERAVELLYESESKGLDPAEVVAALPLTPDAYALELAYGVSDHRVELDRLLGRYARSWSVERMAVTDRTVLRLGAFELATQTEVPAGAVLSEAVELGGQYGSSDDTSKFVNGVLASVADEVRGDQRPWKPIDAVVFDMDGVIRHWHQDDLADTERAMGLEPGTVAAAAFAEPTFGEMTIGVHTAEEWAAMIGRAVADAAEADLDADEIAELWLRSNWSLDDDVISIARGLAEAGTHVALFSNASTRLEADIIEMGLDGLFAVVANSSRLGAAKPDVDAFRRVAEMVDADPQRTLFVDDRAENVAGAVDAGWHAVEMRGAVRLGGVLRRLDVVGAPDPA